MAAGARGDAAREEATGRTSSGVVGEGGESVQVSHLQQGGWATQTTKDEISHGSWRKAYSRSVGHI